MTAGEVGIGRLEIVQHDDAVVAVELLGEHDIATAPRLREVVTAVLEEGSGAVVDLTGTTFIDLSIIRALLDLHDAARRRRQGFALQFATHGPVQRVFEVTALLQRFEHASSREGAGGLARRALRPPVQ